jgi:hypothetical protein
VDSIVNDHIKAVLAVQDHRNVTQDQILQVAAATAQRCDCG